MTHLDLDAAAHKRVLFLGETIYDIYHYGRLLARPSKEPIIAIEHTGSEAFTGGVVAAARHAVRFCGQVHTASAVVIGKERFVEEAKTRKLFEIYGMETRLGRASIPTLADYEVIAVADYGHGMMTPSLISQVCNEAKFLAVNVQSNAGNYGFNLATKYPRADYLCMDEMEARLATQNRDGAIQDSLEELSRIAPRVVITLGRNGAIGRDSKGVHKSEAFSDGVVDTMGAGDAFFAITALFAEEMPMPDLLRLGNAAGKAKAQIVGHRQPVTKDAIRHYLAG